jgi:hypothetical protein
MTTGQIILLIKLSEFIVCSFAMFLGYRLYSKGIVAASGNVTALWGDKKLVLQRAAPGVIFSLFGLIGLVVSISKGVDWDKKSKGETNKMLQELTISDSVSTKDYHVNFDSIYSLGKKRFSENKFLEAYKQFLLCKGASYCDTLFKSKNLDENLNLLTKLINRQIEKTAFDSNETVESVNINDEKIK